MKVPKKQKKKNKQKINTVDFYYDSYKLRDEKNGGVCVGGCDKRNNIKKRERTRANR